MTPKTQVTPVSKLIEIAEEAYKAIEKDLASSVFLYDYTNTSEFPTADDKIKAIGTVMLKIEQNRDKLSSVGKLLENYRDMQKNGLESIVELG